MLGERGKKRGRRGATNRKGVERQRQKGIEGERERSKGRGEGVRERETMRERG